MDASSPSHVSYYCSTLKIKNKAGIYHSVLCYSHCTTDDVHSSSGKVVCLLLATRYMFSYVEGYYCLEMGLHNSDPTHNKTVC